MREDQGFHKNILFAIEPFLKKGDTNRITRQFQKRWRTRRKFSRTAAFVFFGLCWLPLAILIAYTIDRETFFVHLPLGLVIGLHNFLDSFPSGPRPSSNSMNVVTSGKANLQKLLGRGYSRSELVESTFVDFLGTLHLFYAVILPSVIGGIVITWWVHENPVPWYQLAGHLCSLIAITLLLHRVLTPTFCRFKFLFGPPLRDNSDFVLVLSWCFTVGMIGAMVWVSFAFSVVTPNGLFGSSIASVPHGVASIVSLLVALGALLVWKLLEKVTYSTCLGMLKRSIRLRLEQS